MPFFCFSQNNGLFLCSVMGNLYLIPTPVGNMEDMTFRAIRLLKEADLILAEDTRTSGILMKHYDIHKPLVAHHKFKIGRAHV